MGRKDIALTLQLRKYKPNNNSPEVDHTRYLIRDVLFQSNDSDRIHLRKQVLLNATAIKEGRPYDASALQRTYNNFARLQAVKYTNIKFAEVPDTNLLDCHIQISTNKPSTISFQPEGTNTAGDLGAAASITYTNRNLFHGSEQLSIEFRGAYEAITGLEGYQDQNYTEFSVETKLVFPRFLAPFLSKSFRRRQTASSEWAVSWDFQNRPEFHRRVFSSAWRYRWSEPKHHLNYRFDLLDLNYVYMPWISSTFKRDYLDNAENRNAILRYNYEDIFIMKTGFTVSYTDGVDAVRANFESAGNLLNGVSKGFGFKTNSQGQHTLFNIAYAQYVKFDFDYTHLFQFDKRNALALHAGLGVAYVKLDLNAEYRSSLFWKLQGALFIDAGNIWTLRNYAEQPGGQFKFTEFYKQIAASYGMGLRLNFDYFILRFDVGMKAINPAYESEKEHWSIIHPKLSRDFDFHFAVGLPF